MTEYPLAKRYNYQLEDFLWAGRVKKHLDAMEAVFRDYMPAWLAAAAVGR